ncbi:hypothetical protein Q765_03345 [Flavobacterium rivuli WB 3.3-2 = DSM 21788]|uniref:Uncharacterized protein n=1 Tax=Flavobacterium rivuli WB 3.3-2 = DSM 21788 TaxID=1121895 RepID=A0A0A2M9J7_9FLAO|nr:DUF6549 family protein [Flavobacterium rivuli]KGO88103.1 hypothetical protein Q765_03345 [Flavobacterium rivuli WB 3.3-2 = DSM 21788]
MKDYKTYIIAALAIALLFSVQHCRYIAGNTDANLAAITDTVTHYKNKLGTTTASIKTLQLDNKQVKDLLTKKDAELAALASEFANVHSVVKYNTDTRVDTIPIPYKDTVPCIFERTGAIKKQWYSFGYRSNQKGVEIDTLSFPNTATVITGTKRKWFLGKQTLTTDITNSNPYVKVTDIRAVEITLPVPWYKKWWLWLAAGVAGSLLIK